MKNLYTAILFMSLLTFVSNAFGQATSISPETLNSLYIERLQLANDNRDYSHIEQQIANSGIYPSVLAIKTVEAAGTRYNFRIYSPISGEGNQQSVENRFRSMFPEIQFVQIRNHKVDVLLSPTITAENLDLFFYYFGYKNIQLKN